MRIGLYDSGLGGLSVLKELLNNHAEHHYIYFGDNARAPYGEKSPEQLKSYVIEIADWMQEKKIDLLISACNTSSMYLDQLDFSKYDFQVISLFELMRDYFAQSPRSTKTGFLATAANIDSARYKEWQANISAVKCPALVPLIENGELANAKTKFTEYLSQLETGVTEVIVGCTHYSFLIDKSLANYSFIDPAKILSQEIKLESQSTADIEIFCSKDAERFSEFASLLLERAVNARDWGIAVLRSR